MSTQKLSVIDFYEGKSILITGGTGGIGKLLVEKLLRCCPKIGCIYLLVRAKKGKTSSERLLDLLDSPVFDQLRHCCPTVFSKVMIIDGDLSLADLGLSNENKQILIRNISVVFHSAACVRFDMPLEDAIHSNVFNTRRLLKLCHEMIQIEIFVHISTLFSTCHKKIIEECIPFIPAINGVIDFTQDESDLLQAIPQELVNNWPNTYTFSKALAEIMLKDLRGNLPLCIVRPSVILSSCKEPTPGWIENFYGPTWMIVNEALGILRTAILDQEKIAHGIPSDMVINLLLCVAPKAKIEEVEEIRVYNFCSGRRNPMCVRQLFQESRRTFRMYPLMSAIRYPNLTLRKSRIAHMIASGVQHRLTAYIFDLIALCTFRKPRMSRIYNSLSRIAKYTTFFGINDWAVVDYNVERLQEELSEREREILYFDVEEIQWESFLKDYALGIRKHLMKEDLNNLEGAVARMKKFYWVEKFLQSFISVTSLFAIYVLMRRRRRRS